MPQLKPPTLVTTDITAENRIVNGTENLKRSQAIYMIFLGSKAEYNKTISTYSGKRERKLGRVYHKKPPDVSP